MCPCGSCDLPADHEPKSSNYTGHACRCDGCKAKKREYFREYAQRPEVKAKKREYYQRPEGKAKKREYGQSIRDKARAYDEMMADDPR
jgi:hypothetical protein